MSRRVREHRLMGRSLKNPSTITKKQQRLFFSSGSPLTKHQQDKLANEIRSGKVKIKEKK